MKPVLQALLLADHVYIDKVTGKHVVTGIFHSLFFKKKESVLTQDIEAGQVKVQVPSGGMQAGSPFCYISITDVRGRQEFALRYVSLDDDKSLFNTTFAVECENPLVTIEVVLPLPPLPSNSAGTCALELLWNEEPLGSHRITVSEIVDSEESNE